MTPARLLPFQFYRWFPSVLSKPVSAHSTRSSCYPRGVISRRKAARLAAVSIFALACVIACHKEEQAVVGVAHNAADAEHRVQAAVTERDRERTALAHIPLPTKSLYINVHEPAEWSNPFISVDADYLTLHVTMADANPSTVGEGTMLRPTGARRQELQLRPADLPQALIALPDRAWQYGRVVAVSESPLADRKKRPIVRRNVEATIQKLNDLGIVVDEWPNRY
jgi:hypothetical protein